MEALQQQLVRLRRYNVAVQQNDPKLAEETRDLGYESEVFTEALATEDIDRQIAEETIVMRRERPVLGIKENVTQLVFIDHVDSEVWGGRLEKARPLLDLAIPAIGRIDLTNGPLDWVGTGWLVAENIIVTNRHVAREFTQRKGQGFDFKMGVTQQIGAGVDFLQEIGNSRKLLFRLVKPLHIEETSGPDVAFFEIEMVSGDAMLARPIELAGTIAETVNVATIGYPAYDSRIPEPDLMERIYGKVYNKKRLAPGSVTRVDQTRLWHNCTTLGGNSGSTVLDLDSGQAVGLHFSGSFLITNYAVRADVVKHLLDNVRTGPRRAEAAAHKAGSAASRARAISMRQPGPAAAPQRAGRSATVTIPLTVNISVEIDPAAARSPGRIAISAGNAAPEIPEFIDETEAPVANYRDRQGYGPGFLGQGVVIDFPEVVRDADDILAFEQDGRSETELRYQHFSVVMSRSRRMCFLSACNIDGSLSRKTARVAWKWDPRIPKSQQVMRECYGTPPKFSRGHMTRREDPGWGTPAVAKRGSEDSMHVTNAAPQMQAFNAPIWLALEDYALQHAREDDMKISVFTGPYFGDDNPEMFGVRIPLAFWKVIAFIHDETGRLCATGYEMNQEHSVREAEEFVFGHFTSPQLGIATQVPIRTIETLSGISFGRLAALDPLVGNEESLLGVQRPLLALEQITLVR